MLPPVPALRVRARNDAPVDPAGRYVLYWMIAARRTRASFAFQHAAARAAELKLPLLVLEPLRAGYPWASPRLHRFMIEGMRANRAALAGTGICYYPYVEPRPGEGRGLLAALADGAARVVTDLWPCFFLPRMVEAAAGRLEVCLETVDGHGIVPLAASPKPFATAYLFRRFVQGRIAELLAHRPRTVPWEGLALPRFGPGLPAAAKRWAPADLDALLAPGGLGAVALAGTPGPVPGVAGGAAEARARLDRFLARDLDRYAEARNTIEASAASGLSPWLHFGHLGAHEALEAVLEREDWSPERLARKANGAREGFWGMGPGAEAFVDQLLTWRELGFSTAWHRPLDYDRLEVLPAWARATLARHAADPREHVYDLDALAGARTHDPLWNAAQRQLVREGTIHNYLRMLWGKKILEWSRGPAEALAAMIELNNRYALDGRDPNSYAGILWVLGMYDRPWAPERPYFGTVRYMTSASTARKYRVKEYLARFGPTPEEGDP